MPCTTQRYGQAEIVDMLRAKLEADGAKPKEFRTIITGPHGDESGDFVIEVDLDDWAPPRALSSEQIREFLKPKDVAK